MSNPCLPKQEEKGGKITWLYEIKATMYMTFIMSSLSCYPLIWMFCGKAANKEMNRIHKCALCTLFNDHEGSFEELLQRNNMQTVLIKNLHKLMTEVCKSSNCQNPALIWVCLWERKWLMTSEQKISYIYLKLELLKRLKFNCLQKKHSLERHICWDKVQPIYIASFKVKIKAWNGGNFNCNICNWRKR